MLYEYEPASPDKALEGCIKALDACQVYILIVAQQYGNLVGELSITHAEYRRAKDHRLPVLAFIKGDRTVKRDSGTDELLKELDTDGYKYKRFGNVIELQKEVRAALVKLLADRFGLVPSSDENEIATQTIEATSTFESQSLTRIAWKDLNHTVAAQLISTAEEQTTAQLTENDLLNGASMRGLVWRNDQTGEHFATGAGIVLLAKDPSAVFPQCRILADRYLGTEADGNPGDHEDIRGPMPLAIDRAIAFIDRNTRHPMKIVGLHRIRLDEYPTEALREALVNAVAHRQYTGSGHEGRKIMLEVFADRVVISSPGLPPTPITIEKLRKGKYKPCSRNPVLAQCLSYFHRIEERGSGIPPNARQHAQPRPRPTPPRQRHRLLPSHLPRPRRQPRPPQCVHFDTGNDRDASHRSPAQRPSKEDGGTADTRREARQPTMRGGLQRDARHGNTGFQPAHGPRADKAAGPRPIDWLRPCGQAVIVR